MISRLALVIAYGCMVGGVVYLLSRFVVVPGHLW